ncbi:hypothetical protein ROJ8625_01289 [Roseivivax jejudonensis]|uniref:Uncharacterized protein n=1 Tax=Roseivivax jejudonensis TaxID=1529041 RepID=A0A1X6YRW6_9RHOB|nr:hypothetical protein [Roseivivax jejudonensis]SLN29607.1 hypothetical protein ROJ8625_01289 [Roseivivax jejudonensis]
MKPAMLIQAALTGIFCVVFSVAVAVLTDALSFGTVLLLSFVSGAGGSLFAQTVLRGRRPTRGAIP